jgi:hypothetical protein
MNNHSEAIVDLLKEDTKLFDIEKDFPCYECVSFPMCMTVFVTLRSGNNILISEFVTSLTRKCSLLAIYMMDKDYITGIKIFKYFWCINENREV